MAKDDGKKKEEEKKEPEKKPEPPKPVKLDVSSFGKNGKYTFDIQVISNKGSGLKANIRIIEGNSIRITKPTDDQGFLEYPAAEFTEEEKEFLFIVIGYDLEYECTLPGPEKPKAPPKDKITVIKGGFMANFKNVINAYKKMEEQK